MGQLMAATNSMIPYEAKVTVEESQKREMSLLWADAAVQRLPDG
jgi:hypothetical protein